MPVFVLGPIINSSQLLVSITVSQTEIATNNNDNGNNNKAETKKNNNKNKIKSITEKYVSYLIPVCINKNNDNNNNDNNNNYGNSNNNRINGKKQRLRGMKKRGNRGSSSRDSSRLYLNVDDNINDDDYNNKDNEISINDLPIDCQELVLSMVNITIHHKLDNTEIDIFGSRIEYLGNNNNNNNIDDKLPFLFIHIPKTGGTSLGEFFEKHLKRWGKSQESRLFMHYWSPGEIDRDNLPNKYKNTFMIFGHLPFGFDKVFLNKTILKQLKKQNKNKNKNNNNNNKNEYNENYIIWENGVNFTYATLLREPTDRVRSHYWYHKFNQCMSMSLFFVQEKQVQNTRKQSCFFDTDDPNHKWTVGRSLSEWVEYFEDATECMVSHISGCHRNAWYNRDDEYIIDDYRLPMLPRREPLFNNPNPTYIVKNEHYLIARKNLLKMGWVGIFENFRQSAKQIQIYFGKKYITSYSKSYLENLNKNQHKPKTDLTKQEIKIVEKYNQFDKLLYDIGLVLFQQQHIVAKYKFGYI